MIFNNIRDFEKMAGQAKKTYDALSHLLELKTRQANAWEARFAREGGEETARQGTTILVFTVAPVGYSDPWVKVAKQGMAKALGVP